MGRRHQEGRARHSGGPSRHGVRPSGSQPFGDARAPTSEAPSPTAEAPAMSVASAPELPSPPPVGSPGEELLQAGRVRPAAPNGNTPGTDAPSQAASPGPSASSGPPRSGATPAQLRRFIKSRPYVPLHELRRRFGLNGHDDDVVALQLDAGRIFVGLPPDEGRMLGELIRQGEVGCELSLDPATPVVVGVFPIRPVVLGRAPRGSSSAAEPA